jgi:cytochrome c biogenesis protein CcdA
MTEMSTVGLAATSLAGIVSFLSPCGLPLVPGFFSVLGKVG